MSRSPRRILRGIRADHRQSRPAKQGVSDHIRGDFGRARIWILVRRALNNALENGYFTTLEERQDTAVIATDLISCDADLENYSQEQVEPFVKEYFDERAKDACAPKPV